MLEVLCRIPLLGSILTNYAKHYGGVEEPHAEAFSKKMSGFFARWSIKFSAQYYEARRQDKG